MRPAVRRAIIIILIAHARLRMMAAMVAYHSLRNRRNAAAQNPELDSQAIFEQTQDRPHRKRARSQQLQDNESDGPQSSLEGIVTSSGPVEGSETDKQEGPARDQRSGLEALDIDEDDLPMEGESRSAAMAQSEAISKDLSSKADNHEEPTHLQKC